MQQAEQSVTLTNEVELPFNPHMSLKSTTMLNTDKHPTNKRPVVPEMMMTYLQTYYRKLVRERLLCWSNRLPRAAPLSWIHDTRLRQLRVTDQLISTLKSYFLDFWCCHYTEAVKELSQTLVVDKVFMTNRAIKPGLDFNCLTVKHSPRDDKSGLNFYGTTQNLFYFYRNAVQHLSNKEFVLTFLVFELTG